MLKLDASGCSSWRWSKQVHHFIDKYLIDWYLEVHPILSFRSLPLGIVTLIDGRGAVVFAPAGIDIKFLVFIVFAVAHNIENIFNCSRQYASIYSSLAFERMCFASFSGSKKNYARIFSFDERFNDGSDGRSIKLFLFVSLVVHWIELESKTSVEHRAGEVLEIFSLCERLINHLAWYPWLRSDH